MDLSIDITKTFRLGAIVRRQGHGPEQLGTAKHLLCVMGASCVLGLILKPVKVAISVPILR